MTYGEAVTAQEAAHAAAMRERIAATGQLIEEVAA